MDDGSRTHGLALVIDDDSDSRRSTRTVLGALGFDVVQASSGLVGLELLQRLPHTFRLVLVDLSVRGIPGPIVGETLRLFRPELPVLCIAGTRAVGVLVIPSGCLIKPLQADQLRARVESALAGQSATGWEPSTERVSADAVTRAHESHAAGKGLVEAALELVRGYREE